MRRTAVLGTVLAALILSLPVARAQSGPVPSLAGLSLAQALERLRSSGLKIVYSSELVRPDMMVERDPEGGTPRAIVERLLAPHGLAAVDGPEGTLLVVPATKRSRPGTIRGVVRAHETDQPFSGVVVRVAETGASVRSSRDGSFAFDQLPVGAYTITATAPGYVESSVEDIAVGPGRETRLSIELTPRPRFLQDVVVTPSRYGLLDLPPESRQFLSREEVQQLPHVSDDIFRVVQRLPGTAAGDFSAQFAVRGGTADEVTVLLDGLQIPDPFHLRGFYRLFSFIDSEMVEGVDLLTGGFPVEYGDSMSAVVNVTSSVPQESRRSVGISGFNARALVQGAEPATGSSWLVSIRRGYLDWTQAWLNTIDKSMDVEGRPAYGDLLASMRQKAGESGFLAAHLLATFDDQDLTDTSQGERSRGSATSWFAWANLLQRFPVALSARTTVSASHVSQHAVGSSVEGAATVIDLLDDRGFNTLGFRQDWVLEPWRSHMVKWGLEVRRVEGNYDHDASFTIRDPLFTEMGPPILMEHHTHVKLGGWQFGFYTAERFRLAPGLTVEAGVRWDRQTWTPGSDQLSPRLNLVWETKGFGTFRAAWGRFAQSQAIYELQVEDGVGTFYPAELAEHRILTWERTLPSGFVLRAEAYDKTMTDLRPRFENLIDPIHFFPEAEADRVRIAPARAEAHGLELVAKSPATGRWSWWASLAFATTEDLVEGRWVPRSWDQREALNLSINWRPGRHWNLNLAGTFHTGWPATPASATWVERADGTLEWVSEVGERNSSRLPSYRRIDLRVSRSIPLRRSTLRFFFEVLNLTNADNPRVNDRARFEVQGDSYGVGWADHAWVPVLPTFGVTWEF